MIQEAFSSNCSAFSVRRRFAFTLVELLVVIGIIALLISILIPALTKARETANRAKCASNIHQLTLAALMRATDNQRDGTMVPSPNGGSDALAYLVPQYVKNINVGICPSTENYIRPDVYMNFSGAAGSYNLYGSNTVLQDLTAAARNRGYLTGTSYEIFGWYSGNQIFPDGTVLSTTQDTVNNRLGLRPGDWGYAPNNDTVLTYDIPKRVGHLKGISTSILFLDSDQDSGSNTNPNLPENNWPDADNNHGKAGLNIGFCDGHVEWVPRGPNLIRIYMKSYGNPAMNITFLNSIIPGISNTGGTIGQTTYTCIWKLP
jgi:prepilin-type processing-associated H-X9-DG protein/prepilin-type N-terminal cleavage/methylation domain-containing protein